MFWFHINRQLSGYYLCCKVCHKVKKKKEEERIENEIEEKASSFLKQFGEGINYIYKVIRFSIQVLVLLYSINWTCCKLLLIDRELDGFSY